MSIELDDIDSLHNMVGKELGASDWIKIDQQLSDAHARTTGEDVWIHTDPERAARDSTFGGTIAQGSLIISLLSKMFRTTSLPAQGVAYVLNYGYDRVRIVQPVPSGTRVRGRFELNRLERKGHHGLLAHLDVAIELENDDIAPALVAEWLVYFRLQE
jgi:acyl dehydratase